MIIPIWESHESPKENLEIQESNIPAIQYRRMILQSPTVNDLSIVKEKMLEAGIPENAEISFSQWNTPSTNWYIYASWSEGE